MIAVAAMSLNRVIGRDNQIPWHLPEDFRWFKQLTTGHFVLMGRKTFESLGRPLPNRTNIVVTRTPRRLARDERFVSTFGKARIGHWKARIGRPYQLGFDRLTERDVWLVRSPSRLADAFIRARPLRELFVIGGAQIYEQLLDRCTDLYLTIVQREVEGDAFFPEFENRFQFVQAPLRTADFEVRHYQNRVLPSAPCKLSPG
ncbi:MAG TPA: dihydrofolate reductase [Chthoniobacteraceae bacterium]|jgi:dihydrofolate reductase